MEYVELYKQFARINPPTLVSVYFLLVLAFFMASVALLIVFGTRRLAWWTASDVMAMVAITLLVSRPLGPDIVLYTVSPLLVLLTILFRFLAIADRNTRERLRTSLIFLLFLFVLFNVLHPDEHAHIRLGVNTLAFSGLSGFAAAYILKKPAKQRSLGENWLAASFCFTSLVFATRSFVAFVYQAEHSIWTIGNIRTLDTKDERIIVFSLAASVIVLLSSHIGFIIFLLQRMRAGEVRQEIIAAREEERRMQAEERAAEMFKIMEERSLFFGIVTHEVRQPLNNASAILERLREELERGGGSNRLRELVHETERVFDHVTLTLSNALVAGSLLERRHEFKSTSCDPVALSELAALDCGIKNARRIKIENPGNVLFITADPILLQIALRNLLDNALRYGYPDTDVTVVIKEAPAIQGAIICVHNRETSPDWADGTNMFVPKQRGPNAKETQGSGLGLYIVSEIMALHNGKVDTRHEDGERTFCLHLPD